MQCSGSAGQGRAGQGRAGQGRAGQGRAGQGRAGQGRAGQGRAGQGRAGQGRAGQGRAGQGRAGQGRAGQGRAGQGRAGQGRAGQGRAGQLIMLILMTRTLSHIFHTRARILLKLLPTCCCYTSGVRCHISGKVSTPHPDCDTRGRANHPFGQLPFTIHCSKVASSRVFGTVNSGVITLLKLAGLLIYPSSYLPLHLV